MPGVATLTMNPAVDVATAVDHVAPMRKLYCAASRHDAGGGGINVARVARRLGADVTAIYPVGGAIGQLLRRLLDDEHVDSVTIPITGETREDFTVLERDTGQQYRFVLEGPHLAEADWQRCIETVATHAAGADFLVLSGSLPPGVPHDFYARLAAMARQWRVAVALDTSGPAFREALDAGVYLVKPNLRELCQLTGAELTDEASRLYACRELVTGGKAQVVALTLGEEGALLVTAEHAWRAAPVAVMPVSAVGAGDSFLGGIVAALAAGKTLEDAFRQGVAAGSAAVLSPGTDLCHAPDVWRVFGQVAITEIA